METIIQAKIISSLEKCFLDEAIDTKPELSSICMLKNERYSFCVAYTPSDSVSFDKAIVNAAVTSNAAADIKLYQVGNVPVEMAALHSAHDDNYLRYTPGLYPDLLIPIKKSDPLYLVPHNLYALWVTVEPTADTVGGDFSLEVAFYNAEGETIFSKEIPLTIINAKLPTQEIAVTQWLHVDCLANYYNVAAFSDRHFEIIENFIQTAVQFGITQILTPVFTPPLDTAVGGERLTTQLTEVTKCGESYSFAFDLLDRWIDICERQSVKTYEICHLFTQWGAEHAPKIMATVDGEYKQIFGWDTDAFSEEYKQFLQSFLTALTAHFDKRGIAKSRVVFHVSDEPSLEHLDHYKEAKGIISGVLADYKIYDALSNYEFYSQGIVEHPIPANNHMEQFVENAVPDLWTYYCIGQNVDVSNRFMSMPSARNRVIATAFYKYRIAGFLQWGYNFYNNQFSLHPIDPYRCTDGEFFAPSGDTFSVYPAADGTAALSLRLVVFFDALQDLRAFKLCEALYSREYVMDLIEGALAEKITFKQYPHDAAYLLSLHDKVVKAIQAAVNTKENEV